MADLRGAVELLLEAFEADVLEANCHCHLSPPCGDCVEWAQKREEIAYARGQLQQDDAPFTAAAPAPVVANPPAPPQPKHKPSNAREAVARIRAYLDPNTDITMVDTADLIAILNEIQPA